MAVLRRKEDLFLDRADDAVEFLRSAVRHRAPGIDVRHPLSGADHRSVPFFRTVAASPTLVARAREIAAELQLTLAAELEGDPTLEGDASLFAALFIAGYGNVLPETARRRLADDPFDAVVDDHLARLDRLFDTLRHGVFRQT